MRAVVKLRPEDGAMALTELEAPRPQPGQALVKITGGGICGTDLAIREWNQTAVGSYGKTFPFIVGHEFAGTVVEAGPNASAKVGDLVAVNPQIPCGACEYCAIGETTMCVDRDMMGGEIDGGWTEFVCPPERNLYPFPAGTDPAIAPLMEPLSVTTHAVLERVTPRPGDTIAVVGAGPIGLLTAILARAAGAGDILVTGLAADASRLAVARQLGCIPVNVDEEDPVAAVRRLTWDGADVVFETSGNQAVIEQAMALSRRRGRVGLIGLCHGPSTFATTPIVFRELTLIGARAYNPATWSLAMRMLPKIAADARRLVTHELDLGEYETALDMVERREGLKIVLRP